MYKLWNMLEEMKSDAYEWVELSHSMNNDSPVWSGIPAGSVEVSKTVFDWGNPMLECLIQTFKFPGQYGTHIDFPGHFVKDMPLSEAFGAQQMLFPLCVIDITAKVAEDVHYAVTVEDIKAYEAEYGPIPDGAFVALRTDWYKNWPDMDKLSGIADDGSENFPGWSLPALQYIYEERNAAANGHETLDTDLRQRLPRQEIWRASAMCWARASCRLKCCRTWTAWHLREHCLLLPGRVLKERPACRRAYWRLLRKNKKNFRSFKLTD